MYNSIFIFSEDSFNNVENAVREQCIDISKSRKEIIQKYLK